MKKNISIEGLDPVKLYGAGDSILKEFCSYYPALKVVARGDEIILDGKSEDVEDFTQKMGLLTERMMHKMNLSVYDVEDIFEGENKASDFKLDGTAVIVHNTEGKPIKARNARQEEMVKAYFENDLVFAIGPAGTGKTYLAVAMAVNAFRAKEVNRIILTRPAVEAGEKLGFLPGDLQQKVDPYLRPLYDALFDMLGAENFQRYQKRGNIEVAPLAYMRGRTLDDSFIILDEAQNTTPEQMKMFLTRLGFNSKMVITGDVTQIDLPDGKRSGLVEATKILKNVDDIKTIKFNEKDVVRHRLVQDIVKAYEKYEEARKR